MKRTKIRILSTLISLFFILSTLLCACNPTSPDTDGDGSNGDGNVTLIQHANTISENIHKLPSILSDEGGASAADFVTSDSEIVAASGFAASNEGDITDPEDNQEYQDYITNPGFNTFEAHFSNSELAIKMFKSIRNLAADQIMQLGKWHELSGWGGMTDRPEYRDAPDGQYRMSYDKEADVVTIEVYRCDGSDSVLNYFNVSVSYNHRGDTIINGYSVSYSPAGNRESLTYVDYKENQVYTVTTTYVNDIGENVSFIFTRDLSDTTEETVIVFSDGAATLIFEDDGQRSDTLISKPHSVIDELNFNDDGSNMTIYYGFQAENKDKNNKLNWTLEYRDDPSQDFGNMYMQSVDLIIDVYELNGIDSIYKNGEAVEIKIGNLTLGTRDMGAPTLNDCRIELNGITYVVSTMNYLGFWPAIRISTIFDAYVSDVSDVDLLGALNSIGVSFKAEISTEKIDLFKNYNNTLSEYELFGHDLSTDLSAVYDDVYAGLVTDVSSATDIRSLYTSGEKYDGKPIEEGDYYVVCDMDVSGSVTVNSDKSVDLSGVAASVAGNALLVKEDSYYLICALRGEFGCIELAKTSAVFDGVSIEISGASGAVIENVKEGEYSIVVYLAKEAGGEYIRISEIYNVPSSVDTCYTDGDKSVAVRGADNCTLVVINRAQTE